MGNKKWTNEKIEQIMSLVNAGKEHEEIAKQLGYTYQSVKHVIYRVRHEEGFYDGIQPYTYRLDDSQMPKFDAPLEQSGDCLILPDPEFPFHHAEFINRCLDLAFMLGVKNCCIAGDAMHFNSVSQGFSFIQRLLVQVRVAPCPC